MVAAFVSEKYNLCSVRKTVSEISALDTMFYMCLSAREVSFYFMIRHFSYGRVQY